MNFVMIGMFVICFLLSFSFISVHSQLQGLCCSENVSFFDASIRLR